MKNPAEIPVAKVRDALLCKATHLITGMTIPFVHETLTQQYHKKIR